MKEISTVPPTQEKARLLKSSPKALLFPVSSIIEICLDVYKRQVGVTPDRPILIDRFLNHAMECEADAISDGTHAFVPAVMEHIELAGVHSGDSACIIPSVQISPENVRCV